MKGKATATEDRYTTLAGVVRELRNERKKIEEDIAERSAPHRAQIDAIIAHHAETLAEVTRCETEFLEGWRIEHATATAARREALLRGEDVPPLTLPAGCSLRVDRVVTVTDPFAVPRSLLVPDMRAIKALGDDVPPGCVVVERPTLVCK